MVDCICMDGLIKALLLVDLLLVLLIALLFLWSFWRYR